MSYSPTMLGDKLTLTPRVTDPAAVMAEVDDRGEYVTLKALKVTSTHNGALFRNR